MTEGIRHDPPVVGLAVRPGDLSQGMRITAVTPPVFLALAGVTWSTAVYLLIPPLIWVIRRA